MASASASTSRHNSKPNSRRNNFCNNRSLGPTTTRVAATTAAAATSSRRQHKRSSQKSGRKPEEHREENLGPGVEDGRGHPCPFHHGGWWSEHHGIRPHKEVVQVENTTMEEVVAPFSLPLVVADRGSQERTSFKSRPGGRYHCRRAGATKRLVSLSPLVAI
ncbi:uncharacterized protein HMPREF1120_04387 [Exophiala dermatitidis NIH/UT8656]|uniref:Uncharacterized protein n=1 Tax=Exophiala dermatitidis (strain ATCC 34100 / CBS 525.76 / NIH/UT8656) TaxID=858893 RepID=H6BZW7_EXODN|nr:uncharacterized protein HMPREF1120_04387 [Exophiala dermatitidis NIH/UT8656]EHY56302.1 hypothetical protein HMPREF1120_04387 [Exophiala dermatitidis NIH/UT8656]